MPGPDISSYAFEQLDTSVAAVANPGDLLAAAWAQADEIRETARREAYAAGYSEGLAQAQQQAQPLLTALTVAVGEVAGAREELTERLTHQAAEVAMTVAEQILTAALEIEPERVIDVARGALRRLSERHRLTLVVSPSDLELLTRSAPAIQAQLGGIEQLDVQADRRVCAGGCVVRSAHGEIDATITTQLHRAREIVESALSADLEHSAAASGEMEDGDGV